MTFRVEVSRRVQKAMARLPRKDQARIIVVLQKLSEDPRPQGCRLVKDAPEGTYRARVGNYRVIYTVVDAEKVIVIARLAKQDEST